MRAARAAAARGEAGGGFSLRGPSDQYYAEQTTRGSSQHHSSGGSRPRVRMLPPGRHASVSRGQTTPSPKQKRVPKGSAGKRSRVVAGTVRGPAAYRQRDADSRFPMPYPGVDREAGGRLETHQQRYFGHHPSERGPNKRAGYGHPGSRRTMGIEDHSHGPAGRRRARPRSAVVVPLSRTGSGRVYGHGQPPVTKSKRKQEFSKAVASAEERGRAGGSKRLR